MWVRVGASVAFSISVTLILMFAISRFPGLEIPLPYWIFGVICPGVISFSVSVLLARQTERIRQLQRQRDEFVDLLSHDMRAPQASILALLDDPAQPCCPDLSERIRGYARRTLALADGMVHLSRAQQASYRQDEVDLIGIAQAAVDALAPQATIRDVTIVLASHDDVVPVRGEASLLARALINLLDNAVRFSPPGGTIRLTVARAGREHAVCAITDDGPGIAADKLPGLFQRFGGDGASPSSAGLGLAFVRTVIGRHGGTIACDSGEGQGTTFRVELPALA
ncbi:HAMP domain-containing sensor histidine kinase [Novosphingobium sp.]|uniref:sensor histidine kinase n=1 Tax=Novosphingobium sp. TaxID=1874826 RepID=UPI0026072F0D|nr:HAMP domain-containing sensor histidine kinase [Novosphingobium sp.]